MTYYINLDGYNSSQIIDMLRDKLVTEEEVRRSERHNSLFNDDLAVYLDRRKKERRQEPQDTTEVGKRVEDNMLNKPWFMSS